MQQLDHCNHRPLRDRMLVARQVSQPGHTCPDLLDQSCGHR